MIARLLQFHLHDQSAYDAFAFSDDGLFEYRWFDFYWSSALRHPYLIRVDDHIAGFAFVREREDEPSDWQWQIAEFFILRGLRRRGIGIAAALELLRSRIGVWEFAYDMANEPAKLFWKEVAFRLDESHAPISSATGRECYHVNIKPKRANKALEPTRPLVTGRAAARPAPSGRVAHL